jgi:hypothetical protein
MTTFGSERRRICAMTSVDMRKRLVGMEVRFARPVADLLCAEGKPLLVMAIWLSRVGRKIWCLPNRRKRFIDPDASQDVVKISFRFQIV